MRGRTEWIFIFHGRGPHLRDSDSELCGELALEIFQCIFLIEASTTDTVENGISTRYPNANASANRTRPIDVTQTLAPTTPNPMPTGLHQQLALEAVSHASETPKTKIMIPIRPNSTPETKPGFVHSALLALAMRCALPAGLVCTDVCHFDLQAVPRGRLHARFSDSHLEKIWKPTEIEGN